MIIVIDALRADHLGSYGYHRPTSPNMDRLAATGIRFVNGISTSPWTLPSIATMMTGLYPSVHGAVHPSNVMACMVGARCQPASVLDDQRVTLAEVLQRHGLATTAFVPGRGYVSRPFGFAQGFDTFVEEHVEARFIVEAFDDWLAQQQPQRFFAYLHMIEVHAPYTGPNPARYQSDDRDPMRRARAQALAEEVQRYRSFAFDRDYSGPVDGSIEAIKRLAPRRGAHVEPRDLEQVIARYDQGIAYVDYWIGELMRVLDARGVSGQTIVFLTADHGDELHDHGGFDHGATFYDEMMRVPFILRVPGLGAGRVVEDQVGLIDVLPTLMELLGVDEPFPTQGRSLRPLLSGGTLPERTLFGEAATIPGLRALRTNQWKYIRFGGGPELYDLLTDARETRNLCKDDPARCQPFSEQMDAVLAEMTKARKRIALPTARPAVIDDDTRERLRGLGYE
jgi:arylsulfatase A-like enzyme